jgi:hypothetical protein
LIEKGTKMELIRHTMLIRRPPVRTHAVHFVLCALVAVGAFGMLGASRAIATTPVAANATADRPPVSTTLRAVEITFLKSLPGKREQLERFIRANWFPPDEIAVEQGLMVSYEWLDSGDDIGKDSGAWNAMVIVTYPNESGFAGVKPQWDKLLAEYRTKNPRVLIDGLGFPELGKIVESRKFYERAPLMTKKSSLK